MWGMGYGLDEDATPNELQGNKLGPPVQSLE